MNKNFVLFSFILICMVAFVMLLYSGGHSSNGSSNKNESCSDTKFVGVNGYIFSIPRVALNGVEAHGKFTTSLCTASIEDHLEVEELVFQDTLILEEFPDYKHRIQYFLTKVSPNNQVMPSLVISTMAESGLNLDDLPVVGDFRVYSDASEQTTIKYYFFNAPSFTDANGNPALLWSCREQYGLLSCSVNMQWREGVLLKVRTTGNNPKLLPMLDDLQAWANILPQYIDNLESKFWVRSK